MKKIVFAALESYSLVGGLQQFNRRVVSALAELAGQHTTATPIIILKGDNPEYVAHCSEQVIFKTCGEDRFSFLRQVFSSARVSDILLLGHINLLPLAPIAKLINPKLKIMLFVHGDDVWNDPVYRKMRPWEPLLLKFVDRISSVSAFTAYRMSEAFQVPYVKFSVLPNAVDLLLDGLTEIKADRQVPLILTVARLAEHDSGKHHDSIIRALPTILQQVPNVCYRIVGDGVLRPKLQALATELGVANAVEFTGRVSDEALAQSYAQASVFAMPSEKEGFGIVFLEAWQRNVPVICGTEDASHEVITDGVDGFAIHHDDIQTLASKLILLLQNPHLANEMGKAGNQKVKDNYLMKNFVENLDTLLNKVAE